MWLSFERNGNLEFCWCKFTEDSFTFYRFRHKIPVAVTVVFLFKVPVELISCPTLCHSYTPLLYGRGAYSLNAYFVFCLPAWLCILWSQCKTHPVAENQPGCHGQRDSSTASETAQHSLRESVFSTLCKTLLLLLVFMFINVIKLLWILKNQILNFTSYKGWEVLVWKKGGLLHFLDIANWDTSV